MFALVKREAFGGKGTPGTRSSQAEGRQIGHPRFYGGWHVDFAAAGSGKEGKYGEIGGVVWGWTPTSLRD